MKRSLLLIGILTLPVALGAANLWAAETSDDPKPSVTVFPVVTKPAMFSDEMAQRVGIVVATFLEKAGLEDLEVADGMFNPPETDDVNKMAEAFGKHVEEDPIQSDYAVFAQLVGTPGNLQEIRTIVVDKSGKKLLAESAGQPQFDKAPLRPSDPMSCCVFVAGRLQELWKLEDPLRPNAPEGKMARFWRDDAGIPDEGELEAITKRAEKLKKNVKTATCTVYPVNVGRQADRQCAVDLVTLLNDEELCKAEISKTDPALSVRQHSNEQKVLWDTARAFRDFVRKTPPATDYAAYVDHALFGSRVRYVHVILCDQSGDWTLIDMQNSHHEDFQRIDPKSKSDCNRLLVERLKGWLSE